MPERIDIGVWYVPIATFIIVGTSNAVNLADGLDALAGSLAAVAFAAYGVIAFLQGQIWLVAFDFTVAGAIFAFLWYNAYPAELFMGDTGALSLGATLAVVALMIGGGILAGIPLLAGFGPRLQIIHASAEVNPVLPMLLILGGLGVAIGFLRGLKATMAPERELSPVTFAEPRLLLILISLLIVVSVLLGLFPALLIEPLQLLTMSVSVPIQ